MDLKHLFVPAQFRLCSDTRELLNQRAFGFALLNWAEQRSLPMPSHPVVSNDVRIIYSKHVWENLNEKVREIIGLELTLNWTFTGVYETYCFLGAQFRTGEYTIRVYYHTQKLFFQFWAIDDKGLKRKIIPPQVTELYLRTQ